MYNICQKIYWIHKIKINFLNWDQAVSVFKKKLVPVDHEFLVK